jgi:type I restriction enzyme S subunit
MSVESIITENLDIWTSAIKIKSASGRGSSSKLELYGIKKLRELILELAVTGKLLKANPNELSKKAAIEEYEIAKALKLEMINSGRASKTRGVSENEGGVIHSGYNESWETCLLDDIAWPQAGFAFKSNSFNEDGVGLPIIRIRDVGNDFSGTFYDGDYRDEFLVSKGDILVSMDGEFRVRRWKNSNALLNQRVSRIHFVESVDNKFFEWALQIALRSLQGAKSYTTVDHLSTKQIGSSKLPFPPISEQKEIVNRVDELMSLCDQLESQTETSIEAHQTLVKSLLETLANAKDADELNESWQRISAHFDVLFTTEESIDQLKQTILQLAVMGKLVKQDPNDEPASKLLERIAAEKEQLIKDKKIKRQKSLPALKESELPFALPTGWEWARVWDVAHTITSGSRDWAKYYSDHGAIFVTMGNLSRNSYKLRLENIRYVTPPETGEGTRTKLEENDLLISITGDVGNLGLIPPEFGEAYINQHTAMLRLMPECQNRFFAELMRSPLAKYQFDAPQRGIKNSFRLGDVGEMYIPIPPISEQIKIVEKIDHMMMVCDSMIDKLKELQITKQKITDSILITDF